MTSEMDTIETSEFLRRRKLRLQQVREQSKEIAKKLRERASAQTLQNILNLDTKKEKEYIEKQEKVVLELEELYSKQTQNIGDGHRKASALNNQGSFDDKKLDKSRQRGKAAATVLREQKQEQLDKQNKLLTRKVLAREIANEISRDKTKTFPAKLIEKCEKEKVNADKEIINNFQIGVDENKPCKDDVIPILVTKSDMATQWDNTNSNIPDWEPSIPPLPLRDKDIQDSDLKTTKCKRMDLFAVSEEMPPSLRRDPIPVREYLPVRPSLTLVSEFLHNRNMRLREPVPIKGPIKRPEDLQTIKQTILCSRASKDKGITAACQVHDSEVIPVPSWKAGAVCCCVGKTLQEVLRDPCTKSPKFKKTIESLEISHPVSPSNTSKAKTHKVIPPKLRGTSPSVRGTSPSVRGTSPSVRGTSPSHRGTSPSHRGTTLSLQSTSPSLKKKVNPIRTTGDGFSTNTKESSNRTPEGSQPRKLPVTVYSHISKESKTTDSSLSRRNPVTVYNHMLKDATKVHRDNSEILVIRNDEQEEDAFTKAMRKVSSDDIPQKDIRPQDHRSRLAINKQNVDKEYKDTMAFLNTLSKTNNTRPNKKAFMDEARHRNLQESRQHKMNSDFRRIQKEIHHGLPKPPNVRRPKSPQQLIEDFEERSFQYSWRPVPDNDTPCEAHNVRERNSVRFHDNYQEYKLQHKYSPPTKEKQERRHHSPTNETQDPEEYSTATSDYEDDFAQKETVKQKDEGKKIIPVSEGKDRKKKSKLTHETVPIPVKDKEMEVLVESRFGAICSNDSSEDERRSPLRVKEGIYKAVSEKAKGDNVLTKRIFQFPSRVSPRNNSPKSKKVKHTCKKKTKKDTTLISADVQTEERAVEISSLDSDNHKTAATNTMVNAQETQTDPSLLKAKAHPSGANSTTSYKSSVICDAKITEAIEANFVKVLDEGDQKTGKFYIGASGFVNDQSYEVVIQLRKNNAGTQAASKTQLEAAKKFEEKGINVDQVDIVTEPESKIECQEIPQNQQQNITISNTSVNESPIPIQEPLVTEIPDTDNNNVIHPKLQNFNNHTVANTPVYITNVHVTGPVAHIPEPNTEQTKPSKTISVPRHVMSSSASTTYMSPPDNIRPTYLRNNANNQDTDADISEINDCEKKCQKYHMQSDRSHSTVTSMKSHNEKRKCPETPPNTRTQSKCSHKHKHNKRSKTQKNTYISPYSPRGLSSHKKSERYSSDRSKQPTGKTVTLNKLNKSRKNNIFKQDHINRGKSNLNPIVKNYVNKVLSLNKEGLRAMEVMNQDCSYVPTPGSSVVNIPNNIKDARPNTFTKISLTQITEILKQQIIDDIARNMNSTHEQNSGDSNSENYRRKQKPKSIHNRKKSLHKVKTLYISKNFKMRPLNIKNLTSDSNDSKQYVYKKPTCRKNSKNISDISCDAGKSRNNTPRSTESTNSRSRGRPATPIHETKLSVNHQRHCHHSDHTNGSPDDNKNKKHDSDPTTSSTQTLDNEMKIVKIASDKLENMQKIADLTEKCTQRLTNLAKILEEVRKNRSAAYNPLGAVKTSSDTESNSMEQPDLPIRKMKSFENVIPTEAIKPNENTSANTGKETTAKFINFDFLKDIRKPDPRKETPKETMSIKTAIVDNNAFIHKIRSKPPPALASINLKNSEDYIIPHELSTVLEVDSPMSLKTKSSGTNQRNKTSTPEPSLRSIKANEEILKDESKNVKISPNLSVDNKNITHNKLKMMDLNKFNEIMLKPYMSLEEYAKQCNIGLSDEGSNLEDLKTYLATDDLTSLHSENTSIPDVIAELLKRNLISEPFKFDTASHVNSTTASSESSVSVFALSKIAREKKKETIHVKNKDTSDSMSVSSTPDLEDAFKNLGMGWASSTLKKTQERLALSSSSSSISCKLEKPPFKQTDIGASVQSKKKHVLKGSPAMKIGSPNKRNTNENSNTEQQTSTSKIMTVKEFLENELAEKITFSQSRKDETDQFVSLYDTKLPEEIRNPTTPRDINESLTNLIRVRTSTPVQMFKSGTYDSSSSTNNNSNVLFNMDELSSVKGTSSSVKNNTTSDKYDLTIPNLSLRSKKDQSDSKTDSCDPSTGS